MYTFPNYWLLFTYFILNKSLILLINLVNNLILSSCYYFTDEEIKV